ncbi:Sperm-associated antigen 4 protein [Coniosporium apollinis]|uniref:Sperm-associated antigen 4 protein n=1 Tax=Coniosporium apollinis TaxID=61459 RepID=A0ABQ9NVJ4_9PEZI|nr:Sperm-associated antigen 4 protein [Coniosporium apollinis]
MRVTTALLLATAGLAVAQPHNKHQHLHNKRVPTAAADVVVPGPTVVVYELNGKLISADDVRQGIRNGSLVWAGDGELESATPSPVASSTKEPPKETPAPVQAQAYPKSSTAQPALSEAAPAPSSADSPKPKPTSDSNKGSGKKSWMLGEGLDRDFPDGEIDCSHFPSEYGAIPIKWVGLGGWTGVQSPNVRAAGGFDDIMSVTTAQCKNGNCCLEGAFCSYSCPPGYQKSQWPSTQGLTGQSIGGILCKGGKLYKTNSALSNKLCMKGTDKVSVKVKNTMNEVAAVCRTDYPGYEAETVPVSAGPGEEWDLTCPDAANYYEWKGASTSAQYYVNPKGVSIEDGCQWGSPDKPWGNYAPMNLGVGYKGGKAWLSIFQNAPTTMEKLDFTIEIVGDDINGKCRYSNGQYCSGNDYSNCNSKEGCTVAVNSGTATFVFS